MGKIVYLHNNKPVTDSLTVAESFGKEHRRVMQDIRELDCSEEFRQHNFVRSFYYSEQNKELPRYFITHDGFSFLVMGYTGKEAARFKELYISEFNKMRQQLSTPQGLHSLPEALRLAATIAEENESLQRQMSLERPKVAFAEALETSEDSILVADLAKILKQNRIKIGEIRLFKLLREEGYLIKGGSEYNMPTQRSMDLGIMEIKFGQRVSTFEGVKVTRTPKITGKGQIYFLNKLKHEQENKLEYDD